VDEYGSLLERAGSTFPPLDLEHESILRRRDRKRRGQRIAAGVVGITVFLAAVWIVTTGGSLDRTHSPANEPPAVNQPDAAEAVVRGFLAARGAFDAEAAMTYVADDADLGGLIGLELEPRENERGLALELALLEAQRYRQTVTWCVPSQWRSGTRVTCGFEFDAITSGVLGKGPFTGSTFEFMVRNGEIVEAVVRPDLERFGTQVRAPFAEWVAARHPKDFPVMYGTDSIPSDPEGFRYVSGHPTEESIRLWSLRIPEYLKDVRQGTA
jgi:hypothetical protein